MKETPLLVAVLPIKEAVSGLKLENQLAGWFSRLKEAMS